ncbi:MAG: hypothetical protein WCU88_13895 [Elusimicrobiota bacterium]|jgi:hypothetical protein
MKRLSAVLALTALFTGCVVRPALVIRDRETAAKVKTVAIMPFFDVQYQMAFDPLYKGFGDSFIPAIMFDKNAREILGQRYQLMGQDQSVEALKKLGVEYKHTDSSWAAVKDPDSIRWGYTLAQAVQAGKDMGADAVLLCAQGQYFTGNQPSQALVLRLVDANTGKTLLGLNATGQPGLFSKDVVVRQLLTRVAKEAP